MSPPPSAGPGNRPPSRPGAGPAGGDNVYGSLAVPVVADDGIVLDRAVIGR